MVWNIQTVGKIEMFAAIPLLLNTWVRSLPGKGEVGLGDEKVVIKLKKRRHFFIRNGGVVNNDVKRILAAFCFSGSFDDHCKSVSLQ